MNINSFLKHLRQKPYQTRVRLLWGVTAVAAILLLTGWFFSVKKEVAEVDSKNLLPIENETPTQEAKYVKVERVESSNNNFKIYFSVHNTQTDILNFSSSNEVKLTASGKTIGPERIVDRQNKPFVQKILSKTENFGILIFPQINSQTAELLFEDLYFENQPDKIFKELLSLDIDELTKNQEVRK